MPQLRNPETNETRQVDDDDAEVQRLLSEGWVRTTDREPAPSDQTMPDEE